MIFNNHKMKIKYYNKILQNYNKINKNNKINKINNLIYIKKRHYINR